MKLTAQFLPVMLLAGVSPLPAHAITVQGNLFYEKIPATTRGLEFGRAYPVPAPRVVVELRTRDDKTVIRRGYTGDQGEYLFKIPGATGPAHLIAWSMSDRFSVLDPATSRPYAVVFDIPDVENWPKTLVIPDSNRFSGPFNIMTVLRLAELHLWLIEPGISQWERPVNIWWSPTRTEGVRQEGPNLYLNGSRAEDSDEFDDSMILYLYGLYLLEQFSRTYGPIGEAEFGERLDPRVAWHDGWANFFAQAVLGTPLFIDTYGENGVDSDVMDLDEDRLDGERPGYWSIYSVASFLWDVYAPGGAADGHLGLGLAPIWRVVREQFPQQAFPYLITMADGLIQQDRSREAGITQLLKRRGIQYRFGAEPPVPAPFPRPIAFGVPVTGHVDSLTSKRTNLLNSAHYYLVRKEKAGPLNLRLALITEPAPDAGRLQLILFNDRGAPIEGVDSRLTRDSSPADLTVSLPAGSYVIGVLSYWPLQSPVVFGSANYQLIVRD